MKMGHWNFHVVVLLPILGVFSHFAHDKIDLNVEQDVGGNNLFRETPDKYIEAAAELVESIDMDMLGDKMDLSSFPPNSADYQNLLSDEHSAAYGRHKRDTKRWKKSISLDTLTGPGPYGPKIRERPHHYHYPPLVKEIEKSTLPAETRKSVILPEHMNPGVIFRVRMSDAILRIKQRMYEDPEKHMRADIMYTTLIRKVVTDEITKFHNWMLMYKTDRTIKEHLGECGGRIYKFISYMTIKVHIYCLFDALWIDGIPYIIGDEYSVTPSDVPPMLQCDAAECNAVNFVDSLSEIKEPEE